MSGNKKESAKRSAKKLLKKADPTHHFKEDVVDLATAMVSHEAWMNPDYKWSIDDFELANRLGRGKFGRVYLARETKTGLIVAIKTLLKKEIVKCGVEQQILREIEIQTHLKHPNILQLLTYFHDDFRIYVVLDYAHKGELYKHLQSSPNGRFNEHLSAKYTYQVADAVHYCHENDVIHRDIKPENLLLTHDDNVKLSDFGWSVHAPSSKHKTFCGTLDYVPPEMVRQERYDHRVDNWCIGILCYEFLCGHPPFESENAEQTYKKIRSLDITYPPYFSAGAKDLISGLLTLDADKRLTLPEVMEHFWILKNK